MPGGLTIIMCECLHDREKKKQMTLSHSADNKFSVFQQVLGQARMVYAILVKEKVSTATVS